MKVKELIKELSTYNQEAEISIYIPEYMDSEDISISVLADDGCTYENAKKNTLHVYLSGKDYYGDENGK